MSDLSDDEFRAKARQYLDQHVAGGGKRSDVLKDWLNSDNPQIQSYAQELIGDISPPKRAETGPGQALQPPTQPLATTAQNAAGNVQGLVEQYAPLAPPILLGAAGLYGVQQGVKALNTFKEGRRAATLAELQEENLRLKNEQLRQGLTPSSGPLPDPRVTISGGATTPAQQAAFNALFEAGTRQAAGQPLAPAEATPSADRLAQLEERARQGRAAGLGTQTGPAAVPPPAAAPARLDLPNMPPELVLNPNPTSAWDTYIPAPDVPAVAAEAPRTATAIGTQQPASKLAEAVVKDELVKPAATPAIAGAAEPPMRTGSGQPAFPGGGAERTRMPKGSAFASAADVPSSMAFVPGAQYYDSLANATRDRAAAQEIVRARGYPSSDTQARAWGAEYLKSIGAPTRESMLAVGEKPNTVTGIFKELGVNKKKLAKMGGVAGALVALSDLAKAQTGGDVLETGFNVASGLVPFSDVLPAAAPGVPQQRINEAALLGSPYAQTDWAQLQRLREKAGAGRGFAVPPIPRNAQR